MASSEHLALGQVTSGEELLSAMKPVLCERLVHAVGAHYQFNITAHSGHTSTYYLDLSQGET